MVQAVSNSLGRLDDLYAVTRVTGGVFSRLGRTVSATTAPTTASGRNYSLSEGRAAAQSALDASGQVLDSLYALRDQVGIADGLSIPSQRTDANRFSVQGEIGTLVRQIDDTVNRAGAAGINLLANPSTEVRIQTTDLGGVTSVTSQPMDSRALGLSGLDVTGQDGVEQARAAVETAIRQVSARRETLSNAVQGLSYDSDFTSGLAQSLSALSSSRTTSYGPSPAASSPSSLSRGSFVNIRG